MSKGPLWLWLLAVSVSCTPKGAPSGSPEDLALRGKAVYETSCTACHNSDPKKDGSLGPAVVGSSLALIERRVVYGDYPQDYQPKRDSRLMVKLPHLKQDIPALHAYLNSVVK